MSATRLTTDVLYRRCDPEQFSFRTTAELDELNDLLGQERAIEALDFGVGIRSEGYNLYLMGPPGAGKRSLARRYLEQRAVEGVNPSDWCYINNFKDPHRPKLLQLPGGRGQKLREEMARLIEELRTAIPAAFESDEYRSAAQEIENEVKARQEAAFGEIREEAARHEINLIRTPGGFAFAPTHEGEVVDASEFEKLPEQKRKALQEAMELLQEKLQAVIRQSPQWQRTAREKLKALNREVAAFAVDHFIDEMKEAYARLPEVLEHLVALHDDVIEHIDHFRRGDGESAEEGLLMALEGGVAQRNKEFFQRYKVNLLLDNEGIHGAPVVYEENPTFPNLVGRVEHVSHMGALVTDFTLIKPGALHRANGGYLILDAIKVLTNPFAWEGLKRTLRAREIRIESLGQMFSLVSTVSLEPEPVPLEVKVVLMGDRHIYYLLSEYDPEFGELFKVSADFDDEVERNGGNALLYARLIGTQARREHLNPFDSRAVARIIEHSARMVGDAERLTTHMQSIADLQREADYWSRQEGRHEVREEHVQRAIDQRIRRQERIRDRIHEEILRGTLLVDTAGERVGQINGLSVLALGGFMFGQPSRITATARLGEGEVIDIEREVELGGALHSKGVMIISAFLAERYSRDTPLSLAATLVFEQSYGMVDGDSASVAELTALLSALSGVPIRQGIAVTGSVDQHGRVQPIGGVNEKIEGFFDVCKGRGLDGEQGVLIPASNVKHLMLRQDVVEACHAGRFHIYSMSGVDDAIELLTGQPAGAADADGDYPEGSVNGRVQARLAGFSLVRATFGEQEREEIKREHAGGPEGGAEGGPGGMQEEQP